MKSWYIIGINTFGLALYAHANVTNEFPKNVQEIYQQLENDSPKAFYAPNRAGNFTNDGKPKEKSFCPFCAEIHANEDEKFLILCRSKHAVAQLCLFPYARGHVLIIPKEHQADITALPEEVRADIMQLVAITVGNLKKYYGIENFNIGINLGPDSGGSIPNHLHTHIVPRTFKPSFIQLIGNTGIGQCDLRQEYNGLKKHFNAQKNTNT